jgi:hypothetical protein
MRTWRFSVTALLLAAACTSSSPSATTPIAISPSPATTTAVPTTGSPSPTTTLADGSALPLGCDGTERASETVAFVAGDRAWGLDPATERLDCLFPTTDPGPFAWGPQGDRVLLGGFQVLGVKADAPDLPALDARPATFDWGHPIGLAVVYAGASGQPDKRFMDDGSIERLGGLPQGRYLQIAYHPSGLALGFVLERYGKQSIWISTNEGEDPQRLVFAEGGTKFPSIAFSPDGQRLWWVAEHAEGFPELHAMDLGNRNGFTDAWQGRDGTYATGLQLAPTGTLKSVTEGTACAKHRALVIDGGHATPAMPLEARPTTALGWLDASTLLVGAGGCGAPTDLFSVNAHLGGEAVALVSGVDLASPRTVVENAPTTVPAPGSAEPTPPPGGVG